jgi:CDGSH iron-sulfur domain-containing protein 3
MTVQITLVRNGPIRITGPVELRDQDGNAIETPANKPTISICRCGGSAKLPFCDGSHKSNGFCI